MDLNPDRSGPPRTFRFVTWFDDRLNRLGVVSPFGRDCVLAAGAAVATLTVLAAGLAYVPDFDEVHFGYPAVVALSAVACAQSALLCLRRVRPVLCLLLAAAFQIPFLALLPTGGTFRGMATFVAAYTVATLLSTRSTVTAVLAAVGIETAGGVAAAMARPAVAAWTDTPLDAGTVPGPPVLVLVNFLAAVLVYTALPLIGVHVSIRRRHFQLVRTRAAEAIEAQRVKAAAAVAAERSRLARELHDIAAHHLSGMVVQAAAVERLIDRDPAAARESTAWIRAQGKDTLRNLRLVVGVLRERHDGSPGLGEDGAPVPGLAVLDTLVDSVRRSGGPVTVTEHGPARELPPIADVTLYRVAQEALSNARLHAPRAAVRLRLTYGPDRVSLAVDNDPAASTADPAREDRQGLGLIGMRERIELVGGTLSYGRTPAGGWRVDVTVPDTVPETRPARREPAAPRPDSESDGTR